MLYILHIHYIHTICNIYVTYIPYITYTYNILHIDHTLHTYHMIQASHTLHTIHIIYFQHIIPYIHHESFHSYLQRIIWNNTRTKHSGSQLGCPYGTNVGNPTFKWRHGTHFGVKWVPVGKKNVGPNWDPLVSHMGKPIVAPCGPPGQNVVGPIYFCLLLINELIRRRQK